MGHDTHFLSRLDRFNDENVALGLFLYRHPEIVRAALEQARVGDQHERVAIALDAEELGPRIIVQRNGVFITCLSEGMATGPWPVVSRAQLNIVLARRERQERMLQEIEARSTNNWKHLFHKAVYGAHTVTREQFVAVKPLMLIVGPSLLVHLGKAQRPFVKFQSDLAYARVGADRPNDYLRTVWKTAWAIKHITALLATHPHSTYEVMRDRVEGGRMTWSSVFALTNAAAGVLNTAGLARSVNLSVRAGKALMPGLRAMIDSNDCTYATVVSIIDTLTAHGALGGKLAAEALKTLQIPRELFAAIVSKSPDRKINHFESLRYRGEQMVTWMREEPNAIAETTRAWALTFLERTPHAKEFSDPASLPDDLAVAITANVHRSIYVDGSFMHVECAPGWGRVEPEMLYLPERWIELLYPREIDLQNAWDLGNFYAHLYMLRGPTVRVEQTPGRNDPCHCGSGKKFKKCHGA